mmetsp:Transcript_22400/g.59515  ORF Transcript_22400/g.59515 Transcript_22400/m.59515 type:complete len:220 (-) Transcript_22400:184-843(-)
MVSTLFNDMEIDGIEPIAKFFKAAVFAYSRAGQFEKAKVYFGKLEEAGFEGKPKFFKTMLSQRRQNHEEFMFWRRKMREADIPLDIAGYTSLITSYSRAGFFKQSINVLSEMREDGLEPNSYTYTAILTAYEREEQYDNALEFAKGIHDDARDDILQGCIRKITMLSEGKTYEDLAEEQAKKKTVENPQGIASKSLEGNPEGISSKAFKAKEQQSKTNR